jgi:CHASE2 domain-containing sensor protein
MGESVPIRAGGTRLGVELHATAVSNLLRRVFIYKLKMIYSYFIVFLMALLAGLMYTPLGKWLDYKVTLPIPRIDQWPIPVGLVIIAALYLIVAIMMFMFLRFYLDVLYHVGALGLSYVFIWLILKKLAPQDYWGLDN